MSVLLLLDAEAYFTDEFLAQVDGVLMLDLEDGRSIKFRSAADEDWRGTMDT